LSKLSVTIITYNEEKNLQGCLESVKWADEIVVVDALSSDRTLEIAKKYTDNVFENEWKGFVEQSNFALEKASHEWVLRLDADERVPPPLAAEIQNTLNDSFTYTAYRIPRKIFFMGRLLKRPEGHFLRLFKKGSGVWEGGKVHENLKVTGKIASLKNPFYHHPPGGLSKAIEKINYYTTLDENGPSRFPLKLHLYLGGLFAFLREYFFYYRFLDGVPGLIYSKKRSFYHFAKYAKRWEWRRNDKENSNLNLD